MSEPAARDGWGILAVGIIIGIVLCVAIVVGFALTGKPPAKSAENVSEKKEGKPVSMMLILDRTDHYWLIRKFVKEDGGTTHKDIVMSYKEFEEAFGHLSRFRIFQHGREKHGKNSD